MENQVWQQIWPGLAGTYKAAAQLIFSLHFCFPPAHEAAAVLQEVITPSTSMYTCCSVALGEQWEQLAPLGGNSSGFVCRLPWLFYSSHPQCSSITTQEGLPNPGGERPPEIIMGTGRNMLLFPQLRFPESLQHLLFTVLAKIKCCHTKIETLDLWAVTSCFVCSAAKLQASNKLLTEKEKV